MIHHRETVGFTGFRSEIHRPQAEPADLDARTPEMNVWHHSLRDPLYPDGLDALQLIRHQREFLAPEII